MITNKKKLDLIKKRFNVLDKGHIELIDFMGSDSRIVEAARVSYKGKKTNQEDRSLIRYLMKNKHTSPFEHVEIQFYIKAPIFVARQWVRHRTASWNEISGRYTELDEDFYVPKNLRKQSFSNKQGSSENKMKDPIIENNAIEHLTNIQNQANKFYHHMIKIGVANELARICGPVSQYTEWYWKVNLHNLFHFLKLRMDSHAQKEIRDYADIIGNEIISKLFPVSWEAFVDYSLNSMNLSQQEWKKIKEIVINSFPEGKDIKSQFSDIGLSKREIGELVSKFVK